MDFIDKPYWRIINWRELEENNIHLLLDNYKHLSNPFKNDNYIIYHKNGIIHRDEDQGPAAKTKSSCGFVQSVYIKNGLIHRIHGPADTERRDYYLDGERIHEEKWKKDRIKYLNIEEF